MPDIVFEAVPLFGGRIPHRVNIETIHNLNPTLRAIDQLDPIYLGGYPMALLLAPRGMSNPLVIQQGFYDDHDIYAEDAFHWKDLKIRLTELASGNPNVHETSRAFTVTIQTSPIRTTKLQLIKNLYGSVPELLNGFDFINCAIGYRPGSKTVYFSKQGLSSHRNRELDILNPWMLLDSNPSHQNLITQLVRFKKYCTRWQYSLGEGALKLLVELYNKQPNLEIRRNYTYRIGSGNRLTQLSPGNIWIHLSNCFRQSQYWDPAMDQIGIINGAPEQDTELLIEDVPPEQDNEFFTLNDVAAAERLQQQTDQDIEF